MEQLHVAIAVFKKHHFWFISAFVIIAGLATWYMAADDLDNQFEERAQTIKQKKQAANTIASTADHPNPSFKTGMNTVLDSYRQDITLSWQEKWNKQQRDLFWPTELNIAGTTDFTDRINALILGRPIEAISEDEILRKDWRERYRDYIKEELPKLAEMIGSKWIATETGLTGSDFNFSSSRNSRKVFDDNYDETGTGVNKEKPPIVDWNPANQSEILKTFDWSRRLDNAPTTMEVLYAQEDLWVLETLMKIVKETNGDVEEHHQAAIKSIDSVQFGRSVKNIRSKVLRPASTSLADSDASTDTGYEEAYTEEDEGYTEDGYSDESMYDGGLTGSVPTDPADYRYVDIDYKKLSAEDLKNAMTSPSSENYYLAVAKRLPVRMSLTIDERKLDKLLIECANADLMVEVRQVRINPTTTSGSLSGGFNYSYDSSFDDESFDYGNDQTGSLNGSEALAESDHFDVPVEVYGIIYIYNPVNRGLLGITDGEAGSDETADAGSSSLR